MGLGVQIDAGRPYALKQTDTYIPVTLMQMLFNGEATFAFFGGLTLM